MASKKCFIVDSFYDLEQLTQCWRNRMPNIFFLIKIVQKIVQNREHLEILEKLLEIQISRKRFSDE